MFDYEIASAELAAWLRNRPESWWTVDGDRFLMSEVDFPSPSGSLAEVFAQVKRPLVVRSEVELQARPTPADLDRIGEHEGEFALQLRWKGEARDWLLVEDREVAELERESAAKAKPR